MNLLKWCLVFSFIFSPLSSLQATETIHFWQFWPEKWIQPEIERFEKETGIKVSLQRLTWSNGLNKIITALAADQAPDVIEIGSTWVAGFSEGGGLKTLDPGTLKESLAMWKPAYYKGKTHAVPWTLSTGAIFYNKTLLHQAGFTSPPGDWEELLLMSQKIFSLDPKVYGYGLKTGSFTTWQKFLPFVWSNGGSLLDLNGERALSTQPEFLQALHYYKKLRQYSLFDENLAVRKAFQEGRVGFMVEEPGTIQRFRKESPELSFGIVSLPKAPTGKSISFAGAQMLAITKNTTNYKAAEQLIHFLVQPDVVKAITHRITTLFPSHKNAIDDPFYQEEHPELLLFLQILKDASSPIAHPQWLEIQEIFSEQLERVMYNLQSPEKAMAQAKRDIDELIKESNSEPINRENGGTSSAFLWLILLIPLLCVFLYQVKQFKKENPDKIRRKLKYHGNTFLFLLPWLAVFVVFSVYPILYSLYLSFTKFKATSIYKPQWIGLSNYSRLLEDQHFLDSIYNSFVFVVGTTPIIIVIAVVMAVILNQNIRFRTFYRVAYFMPVVSSIMVIATLFIELYSPTGIINDLLTFIGFEGKHWLRDPNWALPSIMVMNIWASFGFYTLMLLAGLQNIPEAYYEASSLEGASSLRQFFTITLPLLKPTLIVAVLMNTILAFQVFGEIFMMTKGGPLRTTETSVYYLYQVAFHKQKMGYGSAAAYYIFLILIIFTGTQFILGKRKNRAL